MSILSQHGNSNQQIETVKSNIIKLFCNSEDKAYAYLKLGDRNTTIAINSSDMDNFINGSLHKAKLPLPNKEAIERIKSILSAEARFDNTASEVALRVARTDKGIEVDLNNSEGQCVLITEEGWSIESPTAYFIRPKGMQTLPLPEKGGDLESFKGYFNTASDDDLKLLIVVLSYCLRPTGPYPIVAFKGQEGCGKSTATRLCKRLIDPSLGEDRSPPENERDLFIAAKSEHLYAMDNLSTISGKLSDALCRLVTSASYGRKKNYTDDDEHLIKQCKPIIVNGITDLAKRPDLISRSVTISLIPPQVVRDEEIFWKSFFQQQKFLIGYIFTVAQAALKHYYDVNGGSNLRLADLDRWGRACEKGLDWEEGSFTRLLQNNQNSSLETALANDPVATAIQQLIDLRGEFIGTASELLSELNTVVSNETRSRGWPNNPNYLSESLSRLQKSFSQVGITYIDHKNSGLSTNKRKVLILKSVNQAERRSETMFLEESAPVNSHRISFDLMFDE